MDRRDGPLNPVARGPRTAYVYAATLAQLVCNEETVSAPNMTPLFGDIPTQRRLIFVQRACNVVETPSAFKPTDVATALLILESALKPWPALVILDWFWDTNPGRTLALAQWSLYGDQALFPAQIARILWGADILEKQPFNRALRRVNALMKPNARGISRLKAYHRPNFEGYVLAERTGKVSRMGVYALRSAVETLRLSGEYEYIEEFHTVARREARWHDIHPNGRESENKKALLEGKLDGIWSL